MSAMNSFQAARYIQAVRSMIEEGLTDEQVAEAMSELSAGEADFAEASEIYGLPNEDEDYGCPSRYSDDGYYQKNDAGEYAWM